MKKYLFSIFIFIFATALFAQGAGNLMDFDGTDDYIEVSSSSSINFGTGDFSISLWVNSSLSNDGVLIEKIWDVRSSTGGNGWAIQLLSTGRFRFSIADTPGEDPIDFNSIEGNLWNDGKWHHLAIVADRSSNVNFYIDGNADRVGDISLESGNLSNDYPLLIGINYNKGATKDFPFSGILDETSLWNVVLTQDQIRDVMCRKLTQSYVDGMSGITWNSNLKAYYRFDESTGTNLPDVGPNSNNGTWYGSGGGSHTSPAWQTSGAALGDASAHDYSATGGYSVNLTSSYNDDLTATTTSGTVNGIQVFRIDEEPNVTTPPTGLVQLSQVHYFGVFSVGSSVQYTVVYNYDGHPGIFDENDLRLAKRANNATTLWTADATLPNTSTNTITLTNQTGTEYILGSTSIDNPLPVVLSTFYAIYSNGTPTIYWTTESEEENEGWNIYRGENADALMNNETIIINSTLIPGAGTTQQVTNYQFIDEKPVVEGNTYWYWLESVDYSGMTEIFSPTYLNIPFDNDPPHIPEIYGLYQNYPNPFNPDTEIKFKLEEDCFGEIVIYNLKGEKIRTLFKDEINIDEVISVTWNGKDEAGKEVSSGLYFYRLETAEKNYTKKMLLVK